MFKDMRQINPGPTLGSLVQKDTRQVNPGPQLPATSGGGLARLMALYGQPGRGAYARNAASFM